MRILLNVIRAALLSVTLAVAIIVTMYVVSTISIITVNADDTISFKYGIGVFRSADKMPVEVKSFTFATQSSIFKYNDYLIKQFEGGLWADSRGDAGRSGSLFGNFSLGLNIDVDGFYMQSLWGVGGISHTDSFLGGHFQFNNDLAIGFQNSKKAAIGLNFKHISSAGIYSPNVGRDFVYIRMTFPW